jgi:hypothetical protein
MLGSLILFLLLIAVPCQTHTCFVDTRCILSKQDIVLDSENIVEWLRSRSIPPLEPQSYPYANGFDTYLQLLVLDSNMSSFFQFRRSMFSLYIDCCAADDVLLLNRVKTENLQEYWPVQK